MSFANSKTKKEYFSLYQFSRKTVILSFSVAGAALALALLPYSRDFLNYELIFENASGSQNLIDSFSASEPIFSGLCYLTSNLFLSFFILVSLGLILKLKYFASLGEAAWTATIIYFAHFYIIHDVTQIRASFAISLLLSGYLMLQKKHFWLATIVLSVSSLSHISTIIYIPVICYAALVRHPKLVLRWSFVALLGILLFKLIGPAILDPSAWNLDAYLPENARLFNYLLDYNVPEVKGLGHEMFLYLKILAIGVVAFNKGTSQFQDNQVLQSDWPIRAGLVVTFSCILYIAFYDNFTIGARLSDLAAPFECAVLASFLFRATTPFCSDFGVETVKLVRIALTVALVMLLFGPQLSLVN